jgi:RNA polymerase-binding transcription factor DksA
VVIWRKNKKMNVDGVDSNSEIDEEMTKRPPDIADEANTAEQDLVSKKSGRGDLYNIDNVDHKVEDLHFFAFCEKKASKTFSLYLVIFFLLHHCS